LGINGRALVLVAVLAIAGCSAPVANGGPAASPRITCLGVPAEKCDEAVASVARSLPNSAPVSIDVSCVAGTCTLESGAMDTVVTLGDGSQLRSTTLSWDDGGQGGGGGVGPAQPAPPAPALPVAPQCVGVPLESCQSIAQSAANMGGQAVIQIVVTCTKMPCTDKQGEGDMVVTFADGTTNKSGWGYAGAD
jgi:hypothetical protein